MTDLMACLAIAAAYPAAVTAFSYLTCGPRLFLARDHPRVVFYRNIAVGAIGMCCGALISFNAWTSHWTDDFVKPLCAFALPLCILAMLNCWHVFGECLPLQSKALLVVGSLGIFHDQFMSCFFVRNYIVGPVAEELVFRALLFGLMPSRSLLASLVHSSLCFALAHSHPLLFQAPDWPVLVQCGFTFIFGLFAAYAYHCSGHLIWTPIAMHIAGNAVGFG